MMRSHSALGALLAIPALVAAFVTSAFADPAKLAAGEPFPLVDAQSLAGNIVRLPMDEQGRPFVAIFGFSRGSGDRIARWSHGLHASLPAAIPVFAVADLSHVPGLFRGFAVGGIRKQASPLHPEHDRFVLILSKSNPWQDIAPGGAADDAVVVAVDGGGNVIDIERVPYSDAEAHRISEEVERRDAAPK